MVPGQINTVTNGYLKDAYGNKRPFSGVVQPVGVIPLDQNGNIILPGNGVVVRENAQGSSDLTTSGQIDAPPNGVFIDIHAVPFGRIERVTQTVRVLQGAIEFRIGRNTIVKDGIQNMITVQLGPTIKVQ